MKHRILLILLLFTFGSFTSQAQNLIKNGSLESGSGNSFTYWWIGTGSGEATATAETSDVKEGSRALKIEVSKLGGNPWDIQAVNDVWASVKGQQYTLTFWAKAATAGNSFKAVQQIGSSYAEKSFTLTNTWQEYDWTFTAGADNLQLKFQFPSLGSFYIDGISIPAPTVPENPAPDAPVKLQAESGTIVAPADPPVFLMLSDGASQFIRVEQDFAATAYPGNENRMITYTVTFPAAGTYNLYARLRVGAGQYSDDSFYFGRTFGTKSATNSGDWVMVNGLQPIGFTEPTDLVAGPGTAQHNVWKWVNLSDYTGNKFTVSAGNLTQTFQIGSRENGLDFDQFAFGADGMFYTVDNLDKGQTGTTTPPPPPFTPTGDPIAQGQPKFLGNVYSSSQLPYFENYWNQVTPENAGKWGAVEATRDVMNWSQLDAAYNFAKTNGFPFRFHVLIWGNQQPGWMESLPAAEQLEEIKEWFAAVAARYPDIDYIEVVNEPLHDAPRGAGNGNYIEALGGDGATGWDWILNSFRLAREYFPDTKLMINEYSITNNTADAQRYLGIVNLLQAENLIDLIGIQGHAFSTRVAASVTKSNLDLLASAALPIMITELDIDGATDQIQLDDYKRIFPIFWEHPSVVGITLWGWKPGMWRTAQSAYLAYENGAERPALKWLREYVESNSNLHAPVVTAGQRFSLGDMATCNVLGTVIATDADVSATLQGWKITGGTGVSVFAIEAGTGEVSIANSQLIDFTLTSYTLSVQVNDGFTTSASETVAITIPKFIHVNHEGITIRVAKEAVPDHLSHGDCIGKNTTTAPLAIASGEKSLKDAGAVHVYPNPSAEGRFTIALKDFDATDKLVYQIVDAEGRKLVEQEMNTSISDSNQKLKPGIYFIRLISNSKVTVRKIVVQ